MSVSASFILPALLMLQSWEDCPYCVTIEADDQAGTYRLVGTLRSTPVIHARILDQASADIDQDGFPDFVVLDDRDSVAGSGIAVVYDVSAGPGSPYAFWACRLQYPDMDEAIESCRAEYQDVSVDRSLTGLATIHDSTRQDGVIDWETQYLIIPNWTAHIANTLSRQSVELARQDLALKQATGSETVAALAALHAALLLREQHAILHPTGE